MDLRTLCYLTMKEKSKLVSSAILGLDGEAVIVNDKVYYIAPPTIKRIALAGYYFSTYGQQESIGEFFREMGNIESLSKALSCFIAGDESLAEELSMGTLDEVIKALEVGVSLISVENFTRLSTLTRSVSRLIAR